MAHRAALIRALGESTLEVFREQEVMKKERECYYLFLDLHGPETTYQPLFEVLHQLHADQLEFGFPIWWFLGEPGSHDMYQSQIEAALPGWSIYRPEIRYCFVLMSSTGYTSSGEYKPAAGEP